MAHDDVNSDDARKMKAEYIKGATIDDLSEAYGYTSRQVEDTVVTPDDGSSRVQPTQEQQDFTAANNDKKGK